MTADWDYLQEKELDPLALERLGDLRMPTLTLLRLLDLDAIHDAARRVTGGIPGARRVDWRTPPTYRLWSAQTPSSPYFGPG